FRAEPLNGENAIDRDASYLDQRPGCEQGQLHSVRCGEGQLSTAGTDRELRGARVDDRALCFDLDDPRLGDRGEPLFEHAVILDLDLELAHRAELKVVAVRGQCPAIRMDRKKGWATCDPEPCVTRLTTTPRIIARFTCERTRTRLPTTLTRSPSRTRWDETWTVMPTPFAPERMMVPARARFATTTPLVACVAAVAGPTTSRNAATASSAVRFIDDHSFLVAG